MNIEPLSAEDIRSAPAWVEQRSVREDQWNGPDSRTLAAWRDEELTAVALMWLPELHDSHYEIRLILRPGAMSAAKRLVEHLLALRSQPRPALTRGFITAENTVVFDDLGGRTVQMVPPSQVSVRKREALRTFPLVRSAASVSFDALRTAINSMYMWTHEEWAPVSSSHLNQPANSLGFPDEVDMEASSVAVGDEGEVNALALVFPDVDGPILIAETASKDAAGGERLVEGCLRRSLNVLAEQGVEIVEFDGHISDRHFFPNWMKVEPKGTWFRLVELSD